MKKIEKLFFSGVKTFSNPKEKEKMGLRPFSRPPDFKKDEKNASKARKAKDWYKCTKSGKECMSVMFVEATPGNKLLKMLKES